MSPTVHESDRRGYGVSLWFSHRISCTMFHLCVYVGSSLKKNNEQVQDVISDLVNQCTRNTLP